MLTLSQDKQERFKNIHKLADIVASPNIKNVATTWCYKSDEPENISAPVKLFPRRKEGEKFQQKSYVRNKHEEFTKRFNVMTFVIDIFSAKQPICNVLWK